MPNSFCIRGFVRFFSGPFCCLLLLASTHLFTLSATAANPGEATESAAPDRVKESQEPRKLGGVVKKAAIKVHRRLKNQIKKLDLGYTFRLLDVEAFEALNTALKYKIEVEPSYEEDYYTRFDRWAPRISLRPGDLIDDLDIAPLSFGISHDTEIEFARQFPGQMEAVIGQLRPYTPLHLPITAQRAIDKLNPGDFVRFRANLSVVLSAGKALGPDALVSVGTHIVMSGEFEVHAFRMKDNKIRLKLIPVRRYGIGGHIDSDLRNRFTFFGVELADKMVRKVIKTDWFKLRLNLQKIDLFLVDYVFDLNDPDVRTAYDGIFAKVKRFNTARILNPTHDSEELTELLVSDLTDVEAIAYEDRNKPVKKQRIRQLFRGKNRIPLQKVGNFRVGMNLARFEHDWSYTENIVTVTDIEGQKSNYLFPFYFQRLETQALFSYFRAQGRTHVSAILELDDNLRVRRFDEFSISYELKDKELRRIEQRKISKSLARFLPDSVLQGVDWTEWTAMKRKKNARVSIVLTFYPDALQSVSGFTAEKVRQRLVHYLTNEIAPVKAGFDPQCLDYPYEEWLDYPDQYSCEIAAIGEALAITFSQEASNDSRVQAFLRLRNSQLFMAIGHGFLVSLLPKEQLDQYIGFTMEWTAAGMEEPLQFSFGQQRSRSLNKYMLDIQRILNDRSIDLRLEREI